MGIWWILGYVVLGVILNAIWIKRDIKLSKMADRLWADFDIRDRAVNSAGWFFWRAKKPFVNWPRWILYIIGLVFWPIDLIFCELGYKKEFEYLKRVSNTFVNGKIIKRKEN